MGHGSQVGTSLRGLGTLLAAVGMLALCSLAARAVDAPKDLLRDFDHDAWGVRDGLASDTVQALARSRDGFLWVGTTEGLFRFDGTRFRSLDELLKRSPPPINVRALTHSRSGGIWIASRDGTLYSWNDGTLTVHGKGGAFGSEIFSLCESQDGSLWVGTRGAGLVRLKDGRRTAWTQKDGLSGNVFAIREDGSGGLWLGARDGLFRWTAGRVRREEARAPGALRRLFALTGDGRGGLWLASLEAGLAHWDGQPGPIRAVSNFPRGSLFALDMDAEGTLWLGSRGEGLTRLENGVRTTPFPRATLGSDTIFAILGDPEGSVWVGTRGGGLHRFRRRLFTLIDRGEDSAVSSPTSVLEDRNGALWVGSRGGGLSRTVSGTTRTFTVRDGLPSNRVLGLFEDSAGKLWVGTGGGGLARYSGGSFETIRRAESAQRGNGILAMAQDGQGSLWLGAATGELIWIQDGKSRNVAHAPVRRIRAMLSGDDGSVIVGTDRGLLRIVDGRPEVYPGTGQALPSDDILALYQDRSRVLWIGTGRGLAILRDGRFDVPHLEGAPAEEPVFQILEDNAGDLWISTRRGVIRIRSGQVAAIRAAKPTDRRPITYGREAGIPQGECSGGAQPAGWKGRDGRLYFLTRDGVASVDPARAAIRPMTSPVVEQVLGDGNPLDRDDVRVEPATRRLTIRYALPVSLAPSRARFRYRLDGVDADWIEAGSRRVAEYSALAAGNYRFRIVAGNEMNVWSARETAFAVHVAPPFYATPAFLLLCAASLAAAVWFAHHFRVRRIRDRFAGVFEERARLARELHDTLAQGLAAVSLNLESVAETLIASPDAAQLHLDRAQRTVRSSLVEARRSVWDLRRRAAGDPDLAGRLASIAEEIAGDSGLRVTVHARGSIRGLPAQVEEELFRVGQEALSNAVRHSDASSIHAEIVFAREAVRLAVRDDGCGFDPRAQLGGSDHFGLIGMQERAGRLGGRLALRSRPGRGTEIEVVVPLPPSRIQHEEARGAQ